MITAFERLFWTFPSQKSREKYAISSSGSFNFVAEASSVVVKGENPEVSPMIFRSQTISSSQIFVVRVS